MFSAAAIGRATKHRGAVRSASQIGLKLAERSSGSPDSRCSAAIEGRGEEPARKKGKSIFRGSSRRESAGKGLFVFDRSEAGCSQRASMRRRAPSEFERFRGGR